LAARKARLRTELRPSCRRDSGSGHSRPGRHGGDSAQDRAGISRLPPKLRIAATLAVIEELPHKDVAEALGISVAAVKLRVFRALRLLRKDLEQQGITP
jgi:DNA-directed RNA polymerase specialized sigma24 family protein